MEVVERISSTGQESPSSTGFINTPLAKYSMGIKNRVSVVRTYGQFALCHQALGEEALSLLKYHSLYHSANVTRAMSQTRRLLAYRLSITSLP